MAVSGLPDECENHAVCIARLALDMIDMAEKVKMGNSPIVSLIRSIEKAFEFKINFTIPSACYNWHSLWRSCCWSYWTSNAKILPIWKYCEFNKSNGNHWNTRKNQC